MWTNDILRQAVPFRKIGLIRLSLILFMVALAVSCSLADSHDGADAGPGSGGDAVDGGATDGGTSPGGRSQGGGGGTGGKGGNSGTGPIDDPSDAGNMAGGAGPPYYSCEASEVLRLPSSLVDLRSNIEEPQLVTDDAGNTYIAGSVVGEWAYVAGDSLHSPGQLVLVKVDAAGKKVWSKRFGSEEREQSDRLVSLSLTPAGQIVVGANVSLAPSQSDEPDAWGEHRLMVFYFGADGSELKKSSYAAPYDASLHGVFPVNDEVYLWGVVKTPFSLDEVALVGAESQRDFLARLDAQGHATSATELADDRILDLVVSPTGQSFALARDPADAAGSLRVVAFGPELDRDWTTPFEPHLSIGEKAYSLGNGAIGGPDATVRLALDEDALFIASPFAAEESFDYVLALDRIDVVSGSSVGRSVVASKAESSLAAQSLLVLPDHTLALAGVGSTGMKVGDTELRSANPAGPLLMQVSAEGEPLWATLFCFSSAADYSYEGRFRLSYADGVLHGLLTGGGELEVGPVSIETMPEHVLLGFDLAVGGEGGQATR
jgi:hypothetical protein